MQMNLRNASLGTLVSELTEQQERKQDLIVPARDLWSRDGRVFVRGAGEPVLTADGVTTGNLEFTPTDVFDEGAAAKLGMPRAYLRTLRENGWTDLVDSNLNGLVHGFKTEAGNETRTPDARRFMLRTFKGEGGEYGTARALLSDSYRTIDNWDVLMATLSGMQAAGLDAHVVRAADLTNRRMYVKIVAPEINALAPELLKNYRSPFTGASGADNPTVFAGFVLSNSETGSGAFTITPRLEVEVCTNGLTITKDAVRRTHLGSKAEDDGVVRYSEATQRKSLELITLQTRDAVRTFLDAGYMANAIAKIESKAGAPITGRPQDVVKTVVQREAFTKADTDGLLEHFIKGGDMTAGGVLGAITSYAQTVTDADRAYLMEADALAAAGL
jgi:hypothetical protein